MGEVLTFIARDIVPKGLDKNAIPDENVHNYFFKEEYEHLQLLRNLQSFSGTSATVLYPGCGTDVFSPLIYLEMLFPDMKDVRFMFVDVYNNLPSIKTMLDDVGVSFAASGKIIEFYWKGMFVKLEFKEGDIFELIETFSFDIYFEKAFRIMKDEAYESRVFEKLEKNGILISDSGFRDVGLDTVDVSSKLSSYGEMVIGVKR